MANYTYCHKCTALLVLVLLSMDAQIVKAASPIVRPPTSAREDVQALFKWVSHGAWFAAGMHMENDNEENILEVYLPQAEGRERVLSFDLGGFPYSITMFGGKLIVTCETATGYLVYAFAYSNESVTMIVEDGSKCLPELFYFGNSDMEAISIPVLEWVDGKLIPVFAKIYLLHGENVVKPLNLPWEKRFGREK